tara:strand:- start:56679 stop:57407 length:729 start_codon:yes stop_codon:yes gene_type:complete
MLSRFFASFDPSSLRPDQPLVVIGDVHGCAPLLSRALERAGDAQVICVGDYVDRGPQSADVLHLLRSRPNVICIGGNHEDMMLNFLDNPLQHYARWLQYGGRTTMESFGVDARTGESDPVALRDMLVAAMGGSLIEWLNVRPDRFVSGNVAVVHAAADPDQEIEVQASHTLRWGHRRFHSRARKDGMWVVHGHTVVPEGVAQRGRISVDTGAYATGRLTVARITTGAVKFEVIDDSRCAPQG